MARIEEIYQQVAALRAAAVEAERAGGPPADLALYVRLNAGVAAYAAGREEAFDDGIELLTPPADATGESQQRRWVEHFGQWGQQSCDQLLDLVERDDDPVQFTFEMIAAREAAAVAAIVAMPLARAGGELRGHLRRLAEQTTALQDEWRVIVGLDERADPEIAAIRLRVLETFKRCVAEIRGIGEQIQDAVVIGVDTWKKKEDWDPEPSVAEPIKALVDMLNLLRRTPEEATAHALTLFAQRRRVDELFGAVRARVGAWLEQVNPKTVHDMFEAASADAREAATKCVTAGQRQNCEELAARAINAVRPMLSEFDSAWSNFYSAFEGRFTGDVSNETVEMLAEQRLFEQFWRDVEALNLPGEIRELQNGLATLVALPLDGLTDEQRERYDDAVRARLLEVADVIRSVDQSVWERFKTHFVLVPVQDVIDRVKSLPGFRK